MTSTPPPQGLPRYRVLTGPDDAAPSSPVPLVTVCDEHGDRAVVEVVSAAGRARIDLVKLDGRWHIDLPQYGAP